MRDHRHRLLPVVHPWALLGQWPLILMNGTGLLLSLMKLLPRPQREDVANALGLTPQEAGPRRTVAIL